MPEKPHQIWMRYAPRRPPPSQAGTLIRATLRAAARMVAPGAAGPGSVPWLPGSPAVARRAPRRTAGNQLAKRRHPKQALTRGSPRLCRPANTPNPPQAVIRGRPERRPPRQPSRLAANLRRG